ncbi:MAG: MOFRL family protein, partial [Vicinamibacterales bacterium]
LSHVRIYNLIVSDVLGDNLQTIASGPTVSPGSTDPRAILENFDISFTMPDIAQPGQLPTPPTSIVANVSIAIDAAAEAAAELGYAPVILTRTIDGEAREAARFIAGMIVDSTCGATSFEPGTCLLAGGETVVTVRGSGLGGRNSEAALAAAIRLSSVPNVALGFLATDGDDGVTSAAGCIVDGETVPAENVRDACVALVDNDSFGFLREREAALQTGPTGTNVNDLIIGLIG